MNTRICPFVLLAATLPAGVQAEVIPLISPPAPETQQASAARAAGQPAEQRAAE